RCLPSLFLSTPCPCLPGAPELMASHTTSALTVFLAMSLSGPWVWFRFTKGHSGLNHSRMTVFPRNELKRTALPSRSLRVKSGAGLPSAAGCCAAGTALVAAPVAAAVARGSGFGSVAPLPSGGDDLQAATKQRSASGDRADPNPEKSFMGFFLV